MAIICRYSCYVVYSYVETLKAMASEQTRLEDGLAALTGAGPPPSAPTPVKANLCQKCQMAAAAGMVTNGTCNAGGLNAPLVHKPIETTC